MCSAELFRGGKSAKAQRAEMRSSSNSIKAKLVVAGGFMLLFSIMGLICNCFSLSIVPITESLGFTRGAYSIPRLLRTALPWLL